ncbi:MAG: hypothetical protein ACI9MR_005129, partial [Myxococcota bacterium]
AGVCWVGYTLKADDAVVSVDDGFLDPVAARRVGLGNRWAQMYIANRSLVRAAVPKACTVGITEAGTIRRLAAAHTCAAVCGRRLRKALAGAASVRVGRSAIWAFLIAKHRGAGVGWARQALGKRFRFAPAAGAVGLALACSVFAVASILRLEVADADDVLLVRTKLRATARHKAWCICITDRGAVIAAIAVLGAQVVAPAASTGRLLAAAVGAASSRVALANPETTFGFDALVERRHRRRVGRSRLATGYGEWEKHQGDQRIPEDVRHGYKLSSGGGRAYCHTRCPDARNRFITGTSTSTNAAVRTSGVSLRTTALLARAAL